MRTLLIKIKTRGYYEQERQYLFPGLYGNKAVTRNTRGFYAHFDHALKNGKFRW